VANSKPSAQHQQEVLNNILHIARLNNAKKVKVIKQKYFIY
jgi:hypothetical protein